MGILTTISAILGQIPAIRGIVDKIFPPKTQYNVLYSREPVTLKWIAKYNIYEAKGNTRREAAYNVLRMAGVSNP